MFTSLTRDNIHEYARACADDIRRKSGVDRFGIGIITGTGGRPLFEAIKGEGSEIPYSTPEPAVPGTWIQGQGGRITISPFELPDGTHAICFDGRSHTYGLSDDANKLTDEEKVLRNALIPAIIHYLLEPDGIFITTRAAGGGIHNEKDSQILGPGDICVASGIDTLSRMMDVGEWFGPPFLDRKHMPDQSMIDDFKNAAKDVDTPVYSGTLLSPRGPSLETGFEYILMAMLGLPLVCIGDVEPEVWYSLEEGSKNRRQDLHICLVSDSTIPTLKELERYIEALPSSHPFRNYSQELYNKISTYINDKCGGALPVVTHEENLRNAEAAMSNVMRILHQMIGKKYGYKDINYNQNSFLKYNSSK